MLGTAAVASVVMLAMSGLFLVGLDTISSQGQKLTRITQPEMAQAPEVTSEENSSEENSSGENSGQSDSGDSDKKQSEGNSGGDSGNGDSGKEESKNEQSGDGKSEDKKPEEEKPKDEDLDPPAPESNRMWMSIPALGMQGDTVYNDDSMATMDVGAMKLPPTGFPWEENANTYITAHRIGYPGTQSHNQFFNLPAMQQGDVVYLTDANGTTYEYRVSNKFAVHPHENWVTEPQPGGDMISLQTCVVSPHPSDWWDMSPALFNLGPDSGRLIVQAEKVETYLPEEQ